VAKAFAKALSWIIVPYLDETTDPAAVTNSTEIYPMIIADLQAAITDLAASGMEKGRFNKWAAKALLGKVQLFSGDFAGAEATLQDVYDNGVTPGNVKYGLNATFRQPLMATMTTVKNPFLLHSTPVTMVQVDSMQVLVRFLNFPHNGTNGAPTNCCGFLSTKPRFCKCL